MSKCIPLPNSTGRFVNHSQLREGTTYIYARAEMGRGCYLYIDKIKIISPIEKYKSNSVYRDGLQYKFKALLIDTYNPIPTTPITQKIIDINYLIRQYDGYGGPQFYTVNERQEAISKALYTLPPNVEKHIIRGYIGKNGGTRRKLRTTRYKQLGTKRSHKRFKSSKRKTT